MRSRTLFCAIVAALALLAAESHAQQSGTYVGQTQGGLHVQFVVEKDDSTGALYVAQTYWETPANCPKPLQDIQYLSFMMMTHDEVVSGSSQSGYRGPQSYDSIRLRFNGTRVDGTAKGSMPFLTDESPKKGEACYSGAVRFSAELVPPDMVPGHPKVNPNITGSVVRDLRHRK